MWENQTIESNYPLRMTFLNSVTWKDLFKMQSKLPQTDLMTRMIRKKMMMLLVTIIQLTQMSLYAKEVKEQVRNNGDGRDWHFELKGKSNAHAKTIESYKTDINFMGHAINHAVAFETGRLRLTRSYVLQLTWQAPLYSLFRSGATALTHRDTAKGNLNLLHWLQLYLCATQSQISMLSSWMIRWVFHTLRCVLSSIKRIHSCDVTSCVRLHAYLLSAELVFLYSRL